MLHDPPGPHDRALVETYNSLIELFRCNVNILPTQAVEVMEARHILAELIAPVVSGHAGHPVPHERVEIPYLVALSQPVEPTIP